jgi:hypothetical protein
MYYLHALHDEIYIDFFRPKNLIFKNAYQEYVNLINEERSEE